MDIIPWLDSLCPRLQHLLQVEFSKYFEYDLALAHAATQESIAMMRNGELHHFFQLESATLAEVIAAVSIDDPLHEYDEAALCKIAKGWRDSPKHHDLLERHSTIGIGFAYDP